jgi:DNA invertase Pin-like site-specific DNA recombinase
MGQSVMWGLARVSSTGQNPERQWDALLKFGVNFRHIKSDYESGKDFNRKEFLSLIGTDEVAPVMRAGDCLVVTSLDRLGRNYSEIRQYWQYITEVLKCDIVILDMPLLDTRETENNSLDRKFMCDLILQILSYVAEKERINIRERQRQGIDLALSQGKPYGRPRAAVPNNFMEVASRWAKGEITAAAAMKLLGMSRSLFYKHVKNRNIIKDTQQ